MTTETDSYVPGDATFSHFLRSGIMRGPIPSTAELRAQGIATGPAGGYAAAAQFNAQITTSRLAYGGIRRFAEIIVTASGATLTRPANDDTANSASIIGENVAIPDATSLTFTAHLLGAYPYQSGVVRCSLQMLQDVDPSFEGWLAGQLGKRLGRAQGAHFILGNGTSAPQGIIPAGVTGRTATTSTGITYTDLVELLHSVDAAYRSADEYAIGPTVTGPSVAWVLNDNTLRMLEEIQDSGGRPVLEPPAEFDEPWTLLGYPIAIDPNMPNATTGQKPIAFGSWRDAYLIRDVEDHAVKRLTERFIDQGQVGFIAYGRTDGVVQNPNAYKLLAMP